MSLFENISVNDVPEDAKILDVREDYEFSAGHATGAHHLPLDQLPARYEDELDPDEDYYVICRTGGRSAQAAEFLESHGYSAFNVGGGTGAWFEAGKPMDADDDATPVVK